MAGREVDVRLVDDEHPGDLACQRLDIGERHERARGRVRVAEEGDARARAAERRREPEVVAEWHLDGLAALHRDERLVEARWERGTPRDPRDRRWRGARAPGAR